jgi:hypothetical protein
MNSHAKEVIVKVEEILGIGPDTTSKKVDIQELESMKMKRSLSDNFDTDHSEMNARAQDLLSKFTKQFDLEKEEKHEG